MYSQGGRTYRRSAGGGSHRQSREDGQTQVRLYQLFICLALFLAVFIGNGIFPGQLVRLREDLSAMLSANVDLGAALTRLGASLTEEGAIFGQLGEFCTELFGPEPQPAGEVLPPIPSMAGRLGEESGLLSETAEREEIASHLLSQNGLRLPMPAPAPPEETGQTAEEPSPRTEGSGETEPAPVPAAGTVILEVDYTGPELPGNYTMNQLSLGELETVTPVLGHINSDYGYRDHPINGKYQFHGGVDIGGQSGDPIKAFAAGTVEYVGKDDSYGLYLQLDHGNGVKSFYAHCRSVCVKKGQMVALGEKIAEVGSTGSATGPHLHLELKYNKMHLDPIYYIDWLDEG